MAATPAPMDHGFEAFLSTITEDLINVKEIAILLSEVDGPNSPPRSLAELEGKIKELEVLLAQVNSGNSPFEPSLSLRVVRKELISLLVILEIAKIGRSEIIDDDMWRFKEMFTGTKKPAEPLKYDRPLTCMNYQQLMTILPELSPQEVAVYWLPTMAKEGIRANQKLAEVLAKQDSPEQKEERKVREKDRKTILLLEEELGKCKNTIKKLEETVGEQASHVMTNARETIVQLHEQLDQKQARLDQILPLLRSAGKSMPHEDEIARRHGVRDWQILALETFIRKRFDYDVEKSGEPEAREAARIIHDAKSPSYDKQGKRQWSILVPQREYKSILGEMREMRLRNSELESLKEKTDFTLERVRRENKLREMGIKRMKDDKEHLHQILQIRDDLIAALNGKIAQLQIAQIQQRLKTTSKEVASPEASDSVGPAHQMKAKSPAAAPTMAVSMDVGIQMGDVDADGFLPIFMDPKPMDPKP